MTNKRSLFRFSSIFSNNLPTYIKTVDFRTTQTWIVGVEGEHDDHLTTTGNFYSKPSSYLQLDVVLRSRSGLRASDKGRRHGCRLLGLRLHPDRRLHSLRNFCSGNQRKIFGRNSGVVPAATKPDRRRDEDHRQRCRRHRGGDPTREQHRQRVGAAYQEPKL